MAKQVEILQCGLMVERFRVENKLDNGAFGAVYKVVDPKGAIYVLKVEDIHEQVQALKHEAFVLMAINEHNGRHFCQIADKGHFGHFIYVIMNMVGQSLQDLRKAAPKKKLSTGCAIGVGIQCLEALEDMHSLGYLLRDVKPSNFAVGTAAMNEQRKVYVVNYGLCRKFTKDNDNTSHTASTKDDNNAQRSPRVMARFPSTMRYLPINCHKSMELGRKDDLESWLYQQVELTKGRLIWRHMEKQEAVCHYKERSRIYTQLLFGGCASEYVEILRYIDGLRCRDTPNYQQIYRLMRQALARMQVNEFPFDWEKR